MMMMMMMMMMIRPAYYYYYYYYYFEPAQSLQAEDIKKRNMFTATFILWRKCCGRRPHNPNFCVVRPRTAAETGNLFLLCLE